MSKFQERLRETLESARQKDEEILQQIPEERQTEIEKLAKELAAKYDVREIALLWEKLKEYSARQLIIKLAKEFEQE